MASRSSLVGVGPATVLAACTLPSADISTTATVAPEPGSKAEPRKPVARNHRPTVLDAELLPDGKHLRLYLSEPVMPTDGIDPNDFRLSVAMSYAYRLYAYAYYYDLGELGENGEMLGIRSLENAGTTLELELDQFVDPAYCMEFEQELQSMRGEPGIRADGGIFLHYAPGERPIVDDDGDAMSAIAGEWVLRKRRGGEDALEMHFEGLPARRALREPIRVRCGPDLPPGPR
jgi:hypothetical protein